ncbi:recombinase family protein [Trinickia caryophylli]|uniref:Site-specific DNA recombinase n=1 Tax=Trinickia caryophylli TaxID=28094 RepID=A0A1X7FNL6_TRICW|nr:recombinase family protein [Trinickia caryophylli]PMS13885.1 recombinase family protein [Trinickia caryophylli]TRX14382.1 recombinase family protein [Trinickia caryophylli]WQE14219.1 recombinase family protein [Trinickia caryophylli]SMF55700.1 Site-specific DNA recombinase [Trinickia caryophylli]GLU33274.1 recombinase [Trinickia caryophylli]
MSVIEKIGYARVSTDEQHLSLQLDALASYGCDVTYSDQGVSGARFDRAGLRDALLAAQPGTTLVVWRLDRLGRSLRHLAAIMGDLEERKVRVVSLTEYIDTRSTAGRFTFHMLAALAEFERGLISERTRAGVAAARARGKRIGRPLALDEEQCEHATALLDRHSAQFVAQQLNVDRRTLMRNLRRWQSQQAGGTGSISVSSHD